jgi:putative cardiolipin synthase
MHGNRLVKKFSFVLAAAILLSWVSVASVRADTVQLLCEEEVALQTRLDFIHQAVSTIELSTFVLSDDCTGGQILAALIDAAERGVCVRIIVDGHPGSNNLPKPLIAYLIGHGVALRERPIDVRYKVELGRPRIHDKLLVVDRSVLIIGGRNCADEYFGFGCERQVDLEVLYVGCRASEVTDYFEQRWSECLTAQPRLSGREATKTLSSQAHPEWNKMACEQAIPAIDAWLAERRTAPLAAKNYPCKCGLNASTVEIESACVEFEHDLVGEPKSHPQASTTSIHGIIRSACRSVQLASPYFVTTPTFFNLLDQLTDRGVRVSVLTNSLESTNQIFAHSGYANARRRHIRNGIRLYEFRGKDTLHTKLIIVDHAITVLGSHNLDPLSERTNSEVGFVIRSPEFAAMATEVYSNLLRHSNDMNDERLFRYEARERRASSDELHKFQRLRLAAPFVKKYL